MAKGREIRIIDNLGDAAESEVPATYRITSYGADFTVDGLVKRIREEDIYIPPFQRAFVWSVTQSSRFVESLLLGLPVPGIFLSKEEDTQKLLVIDGQQRLRSLQYFYDGAFPDSGRVFALRKVQKPLDGLTYKKLSAEDRRRLDDSILHATVVRQDVPSDDNSSIYQIFARLNTGGTQLQAQEIRTALYHGPFNNALTKLNECEAWRRIYGPVSMRMRDRELILRFLALHFSSDTYARPMADFLNKYMGRNKRLQQQSEERLEHAFVPTISLMFDAVGATAFKPRRTLNAAVFDAVMVGLARRLKDAPPPRPEKVAERYHALLDDEQFVTASAKATANDEYVKSRLAAATKAFSRA